MRPDIAKRRDKYNKPTQAQQVFKKTELILERPIGMSFQEYRAVRKMQSKAIRMLFPRQINPQLQRTMAPKQKSKHQLQMLQNALFLKYGKDITEEVKENKITVATKPNMFGRFIQNIREVFGQNVGDKL